MPVSQASFDFVRTSLLQRSAQNLDDDKSYLVETRLLSVARRHGFPSVEELLVRLRARPNEQMLADIVEAMTINETSFFRDGLPFEALRLSVLPDLIQRRSNTRSLNIWCAASSSGQEPYTVAILCRHYFPELNAWNIRLIASDLSLAMLDRARRGLYSDFEVSRGLPIEIRDIYTHKQKDGWLVRDDIRRLVEFRPINLSGPWPELPPMDLVLLRNVLIYFEVPTKQQILEKVRKVLLPDGYLLLGGAETTHNLDDRFRPVSFEGVSFFQKRE